MGVKLGSNRAPNEAANRRRARIWYQWILDIAERWTQKGRFHAAHHSDFANSCRGGRGLADAGHQRDAPEPRSTKGTYNAADAKLVPASTSRTPFKSRPTPPTRLTSPMSASGTMIGFDVDLMYAIATTLGVKVNENNVTFDDIIAGIKSGKYAIGNSSFTDTKAARSKSTSWTTSRPVKVSTRRVPSAKFTGLRASAESDGRRRDRYHRAE